MTPIPRLAAGIAGATLLLSLAPAVASAADYRHVDAARDVRSGPQDGSTIRRAEPRVRAGDVRRLRISHGTDSLVVAIRTRGALPRDRFVVAATVRTPAATFEIGHGRMRGTTFSNVTADSGPVSCAGYRTHVDRSRRLTTIVVPTACLGSPAWVRVGAGVGVLRHHRLYADDALRAGRVGDEMRLSPRIDRG